jgi:hypothetical protein
MLRTERLERVTLSWCFLCCRFDFLNVFHSSRHALFSFFFLLSSSEVLQCTQVSLKLERTLLFQTSPTAPRLSSALPSYEMESTNIHCCFLHQENESLLQETELLKERIAELEREQDDTNSTSVWDDCSTQVSSEWNDESTKVSSDWDDSSGWNQSSTDITGSWDSDVNVIETPSIFKECTQCEEELEKEKPLPPPKDPLAELTRLHDTDFYNSPTSKVNVTLKV